MVVVRGVEDAVSEVQIGDVVTFQPVSDDPALITHRVVGKSFGSSGTLFITRGDANGADDEPIEPEQIMGKVRYSVPYVGHVAAWADSRAPGGRPTGGPVDVISLAAEAVMAVAARRNTGGHEFAAPPLRAGPGQCRCPRRALRRVARDA